MAEPATPMTYSEALDALSKVAEANGDSFRVKLLRRPNAASTVTQNIAIFADVTWKHIAEAEGWISSFCGGGLYSLQIFDGRDTRKQYGVITPSEIIGAPRAPNAEVTKSSAWLGPLLVSVTMPSGNGAVATGPQYSLAGEPSPFGNPPRTGAEGGLSGLFDEVRREKDDVKRREADLLERERKAEMDALRREAKASTEALERRFSEMLSAFKPPPPLPPPPGLDISALLSGIASIAVPVLAAIQTSSSERAKLAMEEARAREARDREDREREREARKAEREESARAFAELRESMKRPLVDPQIMEMMATQSKRADEQFTQFSTFLRAQSESARQNLEGQAMAQRSMLQTITDIAQLQLKLAPGEEKEGIDWGKVVQGALAGLAAMKGGPMPGAPAPVGAPALPGAQPPPNAPEVPESEKLNAVEAKIRAKAPPDEVIADLKLALEDPGAKAEVAAEGGLPGVLEARLSDFVDDKANEAYVQAFVGALQKAGLIPG